MRAGPCISVLLPIQDERAAGVECVRSWTRGQTAASEVYEIVALAPARDRRLERAVRPLLRAQDRWLEIPGAGSSDLFNAGARAACGEYIFLTESHCVPEPDCLEAMLDELDRTGAAGVRGYDPPEARGALGELERDKFLEEISAEEDPGHWRKILVHSLALRRDTYLEMGGLPPRYGDFGAWVLAMNLDARGERVVFSPRPRVRHVYDGKLDHIAAHLLSFGQGETRFQGDGPADLIERYLGLTTEWEERLGHTRAGARRGFWAALAVRHPGAVREAVRHLVVTVLGPRASVARARLGAWLSALRARISRGQANRAERFADFWRLATRRGRLRGLAASGQAPAPISVADHIDLTSSLAGRAIGFHDPEPVEGEQPIRWTTPLALLAVNVPGDGPMRASLELLPLVRPAGARPARPRVAVDGRAVDATVSEERIEFEVDPGEHWIALACSPLRPRRHGVNDHRVIGLPVRSLSFRRPSPAVAASA